MLPTRSIASGRYSPPWRRRATLTRHRRLSAMTRPRHTARATVSAGAMALVLAACGSSGTPASGGGSTATPTAAVAQKVASIAAEVPAAISSKGTLIVAADATYAPNEFLAADGTTVRGMDAD